MNIKAKATFPKETEVSLKLDMESAQVLLGVLVSLGHCECQPYDTEVVNDTITAIIGALAGEGL